MKEAKNTNLQGNKKGEKYLVARINNQFEENYYNGNKKMGVVACKRMD
jgi:hypothetical protein